MTGGTIKGVLIASVSFIVLGITMNFVLPMFEGFDAARTFGNISEYTAASTVIVFGPALILLGFIITVAVRGFLGISIFGGSNN